MNMRTISTTLRKLGKFTNSALVCNIVITVHLYLPRCLSQETVKGPFSLRVNLPPAYLLPTHSGGFILSLFMLNVKQENSLVVLLLVSLKRQDGDAARRGWMGVVVSETNKQTIRF